MHLKIQYSPFDNLHSSPRPDLSPPMIWARRARPASSPGELSGNSNINSSRILGASTGAVTSHPGDPRAKGGPASASTEYGDGIDIDGVLKVDAGGNATVSGSASATADALALGELVTQDLDTGRNDQTNESYVSVIAGNENDISIGDDATDAGPAGASSGTSSADTDVNIEQDNTLVGTGVGLEFLYRTNLAVRVDWGIALHDVPGAATAGSSRVHFVATILY